VSPPARALSGYRRGKRASAPYGLVSAGHGKPLRFALGRAPWASSIRAGAR